MVALPLGRSASAPGVVLRRLSVLITAFVLVVCACTASPDEGPPPADGAPSESTGATPPAGFGLELPDAEVTDAVTSAGILIVGADGSIAYPAAAPATGVEMTVDQMTQLVAQAESGSGSLGADLDAVARAEIPLSALLAGYARGVDTPAAHLAKDLLGPQDLRHPEDVVFPALVITLFASDMAHAMGDPDVASLALSSYAAGGLCSNLTDAIVGGINAIFDAIRVKYVDLPKTGIAFLDGLLQGMANLVVDGINLVIEAGRWLVVGAAKFLINEVLAIVAKVAALAAMIGGFIMYVSPVDVTVELPETASKGTPGNPVMLKATTVAATRLGGSGEHVDWPPEFVDCAKVAGVRLPPLKPVGDHVKWWITEEEAGLLNGDPNGRKFETLEDAGPGKAFGTWDLVTGTEPEGLTGERISQWAKIHARVEREQVRALLESLAPLAIQILGGPLPGFMKKYLADTINALTAKLRADVIALLSPTSYRQIDIESHEADKKKKPQGEVWEGTWANPGYGSSGTFRMEVVRSVDVMRGSLTVSGAECLSAGHLVANVAGDHVEFGLVSGGIDTITFSGVIKDLTVAGNWSAGEACGWWTGPWEATITPARGR